VGLGKSFLNFKYVISYAKADKVYNFFKIKSHFSSTARTCMCKKYSPAERHLLKDESLPLSPRFRSGISKLSPLLTT